MSSIREKHLEIVRRDCGWGEGAALQALPPDEGITDLADGFLNVYLYPFALGPLNRVVLDFCLKYRVTLAQIRPSFWRIVLMMRFFAEKAGLEFTLSYLVRLYRPFHHRGLLTLRCHSSTPFVIDDEEDRDREWISRFVRVRTTDVIPVELMPFPEKWNYTREWSVSCFHRFAHGES